MKPFGLKKKWNSGLSYLFQDFNVPQEILIPFITLYQAANLNVSQNLLYSTAVCNVFNDIFLKEFNF